MSDKTRSIGVPSVKGMRSAFADFGIGMLGGILYGLSRGIFGGGLVGSLIAPVIAGSMVKGPRGTALATVAGFFAISGAFGGAQAAGSDTGGVM